MAANRPVSRLPLPELNESMGTGADPTATTLARTLAFSLTAAAEAPRHFRHRNHRDLTGFHGLPKNRACLLRR